VNSRITPSRSNDERRRSVLTRRRFGVAAAWTLMSTIFDDACAFTGAAPANDPRLSARPRRDVENSLTSGRLGLSDGARDAMIQWPSAPPDGPVPLLVFLHGATQNGAGMLRRVGPAAEQAGVAVLAPDSRSMTWDAIRGTFSEDVEFLNRALEHVFARAAIDPARVAVGGFSDGASYAISLGLANGDLFPRVVACSPGFVIPVQPNGRARFFISHGTSDQILPIDQCSRVIVPRLRALDHDVTFHEFEGRHEVPPAIAEEALRWVAAR
jgi:phospholipase/carboxylesterase